MIRKIQHKSSKIMPILKEILVRDAKTLEPVLQIMICHFFTLHVHIICKSKLPSTERPITPLTGKLV